MSGTPDRTWSTWNGDLQADLAMAGSHLPFWRHFIESLEEQDLAGRDVLDFGCNTGGFLRLLHAMRGIAQGVGVDVASDSVAAANAAKGQLPLRYEVASDLSAWRGAFDFAFSYEVIYLLPDLRDHAAQICQALRPGGVYYAVTGCHTASPLWPRWRELIPMTSNAPVQDHAPEDFVAAFAAAGLDVSVKRFGYTGYLPAPRNAEYYPAIGDQLDYYARDKLIFRCEKRQ